MYLEKRLVTGSQNGLQNNRSGKQDDARIKILGEVRKGNLQALQTYIETTEAVNWLSNNTSGEMELFITLILVTVKISHFYDRNQKKETLLWYGFGTYQQGKWRFGRRG